MKSEELARRYAEVAAGCDFRLTGHPRLSMSDQLTEMGRWAQRYDSQDVYGGGELIESFERDVAELLGKPAAVFLVSGTMAQNIALRIWADRAGNNRVGFHHTSHLELHEQKAYRELYHLNAELLGERRRMISLSDLETANGPLSAVLLELPMREIGGQLPDFDQLKAQSDWARANGVALHMDGARLWQCTTWYRRSLAEIAELFDSVYLSFYKDMGGIAGSVLAGPEDFIEEARTWIRRAGGNLYSLFPYVLAARAGMERNLEAMPQAVKDARWLAMFFNKRNLRTTPARPPTNLFHLDLKAEPEALLNYAIDWSERNGVFLMPMPRKVRRGVSTMEFSIGQAFRQQDREQWREWLTDFYGHLPKADPRPIR